MHAIQPAPSIQPCRWLQVRVPGTPVPWSRPTYNPTTKKRITLPAVRNAKARIAAMAHTVARRAGVPQWQTPCVVSVVTAWPRPRVRQDVSELLWMADDPDADNIMKLVLDALQLNPLGYRPKRKPARGWPGIIRDDNLVVCQASKKIELPPDEKGWTDILIFDAGPASDGHLLVPS